MFINWLHVQVHASRVCIYKCPSKLNTAYPCKIYWPFLDVWVHQKVDSSTLKVTWETRARPKYQFLYNNNLNMLLTGNTKKHSIFKTFITFLYAKQEYPFNHFFVLFPHSSVSSSFLFPLSCLGLLPCLLTRYLSQWLPALLLSLTPLYSPSISFLLSFIHLFIYYLTDRQADNLYFSTMITKAMQLMGSFINTKPKNKIYA